MNFTSFAATLVIPLAVCPHALVADQQGAPVNGARFRDDVERGMMLDALQLRKRYQLRDERSTTKQSVVRFGTEGSQTRSRQQPVLEHRGWPFRTNAEIFSLPCFSDDSVYFGACDGVFYCVDKKAGAVRWRKEGLHRVDSAPSVSDGTVFFTSISDTLYALKADSGQIRWKASFSGIGYRSPKFLDKVVFIPGEGQLLGLDPSNGKLLRRNTFSGDGRDFAWNSKVIVVAVSTDTNLNDGAGRGSVGCFSRDTSERRWIAHIGGACLGTVVCDENNCYLGARDGFFYALRIADGKIAWRFDGRAFFPHPQGNIWADRHVIDMGNHVVFRVGHQTISNPSVMASAEKKTGRIAWAVYCPTLIEGRFLAAHGVLVAMAEDRRMVIVRFSDGKSVNCCPIPAP